MPTENAWLSLLGMIVMIVVVLALAYWFTRFFAGSKTFQSLGRPPKNDQLRILAQIRLGKDQGLAVVQAGKRYFVLGMTPQSISTVAELTEEEAAAWTQPPESGGQGQTPNFKQAFLEALRQRKLR